MDARDTVIVVEEAEQAFLAALIVYKAKRR